MPAAPAGEIATDDRLIAIREVVETCGMCRAGVYAAISRGEFPTPVKLRRSSRWLASEIQMFIRKHAAERSRDRTTMSKG